MAIIKTDVVSELLCEAIMTDSVNHHFKENRMGESDLCDWVEFFLQKAGIPCKTQSVRDRQRNVIGIVEGKDTSRILCFEAHLDTTTARGMSVHPFGAEEADGHIFGRGACDSKGALAAMMAALKTLFDQGEPPPQTVILAATIDKEVGQAGIQKLLDSDLRPTLAVVGAPTDLGVARCSRGCTRWRIAIGQSPQSYVPATRNAVKDAVQLMTKIEEKVGALTAANRHKLLGEAEIHPSKIRANSTEGFLPPHCAVDYEAYTVPGCDSTPILEEIEDLAGTMMAEDSTLKISIEAQTLDDPPAELPESTPLVEAACEAVRSRLETAAILGYPDHGHMNRLAAAGIASIGLGPGSPRLIRAADECVPVDQLADAAHIYLHLMQSGVAES